MTYSKRTQAEVDALRATILDAIKAKPLGMRELAAAVGIGHRNCEKHMQALQHAGKIGFYGKRTAPKWTTKEQADKINDEAMRAKEQRIAEADAKREALRQKRAAEDARLDDEIDREKHAGGAEWERKVKRVPAESVKAQITGPRSVFDLGGHS